MMTDAASLAALDLTRAVRLFHAFSDETRLGILEMLRSGERCVCDLQADLDAAQSRLSFHLKVLKEAGLVTDRKEGGWSYYTLVPDAFAETHDLVRALASGPPAFDPLAEHDASRSVCHLATVRRSGPISRTDVGPPATDAEHHHARSIRSPLAMTTNSLTSWAITAIGSVSVPSTAPTTNTPITAAESARFCRTMRWLR